jgi:membrane-bound lytic murein transglycosylase B
MIALEGPGLPPCGNNASGFESWKKAFAGEASGNGVGPKAIAALMATKYSVGTIRADRGQKSFKLSLDQFMAKRGGPAIAARGKGMKSSNAALFASIEKRFGVPSGPLIAIWGMETAFGSFMGNQPTISAVATLAYDCRRPEYFTDQLYAALQLVDRGVLSGATRGAMHGEVGQTQFLPKSVLLYAVDGDGNGVVNSTPRPTPRLRPQTSSRAMAGSGAGYQPDSRTSPPFRAGTRRASTSKPSPSSPSASTGARLKARCLAARANLRYVLYA